MIDLNEIAIFAKVAQTGSFTVAGKNLGLPKSTISRKVSSLEKRLGVALVTRNTRSVALTEAGQTYFRECNRILGELQQVEMAALNHQSEPQGLLRITAPLEIGTTLLPGMVERYLEKHPHVDIDLVLTDRVVDLLGEGVDLAIRAGELEDSSLIARRLGMSMFQLFASSAYLKKHGEPKTPADLEKHQCLRFTSIHEKPVWELSNGKTKQKIAVSGRCRSDSVGMIRKLAVCGFGIALLPAFSGKQDVEAGLLTRVLPQWVSDDDPVYAVYPQSRFVAPKVRSFVDLLATEFVKLI